MSISRMLRRIRRKWRWRSTTRVPAVVAERPENPEPSAQQGWWNLLALYVLMALVVGLAISVVAVPGVRSAPKGRLESWRAVIASALHRAVPTTVFFFQAEGSLPREALESGLPMLRASRVKPAPEPEVSWQRRILGLVAGVDLEDPRSLIQAELGLTRGAAPADAAREERDLEAEESQRDTGVQDVGADGKLPTTATASVSPGPSQTGSDRAEAEPTISGPEARRGNDLESLRHRDWGALPLVAVYHTHSSEAYHGPTGHGAKKGYSPADYVWGQTSGVISVGDEFVRVLSDEYRIPVVHSRHIHDYPVFRNAYENSAATARSILARYPSVAIMLDLHRDGIAEPTDGSITTVMAGERLARVSFIVGQGRPGSPNPHWEKNLAFAQSLHAQMEKTYPGLSRGVTIRKWAYNQELHERAMLIEVGDHYNTHEEAVRSAALLADVVAEVLAEIADEGGKQAERNVVP